MPPRRFPPPWSVDDPDTKLGQDCFIVRDANGYPLAYVYFEDEPGRRSAAHLMARDEARRIAVNIANLRNAIDAWTEEARATGREIPQPSFYNPRSVAAA
jgi:hypothetical protein